MLVIEPSPHLRQWLGQAVAVAANFYNVHAVTPDEPLIAPPRSTVRGSRLPAISRGELQVDLYTVAARTKERKPPSPAGPKGAELRVTRLVASDDLEGDSRNAAYVQAALAIPLRHE